MTDVTKQRVEYREIITTDGYTVKVDDNWYGLLSMFTWCTSHGEKSRCNYARRTGPTIGDKRTHIKMHRVITSCPSHMFVDHINGDTLDNRECNLRICTKLLNNLNHVGPSKNESGAYGVYPAQTPGKWRATIKTNGKSMSIGVFNTVELAAEARRIAEIKYFGFALARPDIATKEKP